MRATVHYCTLDEIKAGPALEEKKPAKPSKAKKKKGKRAFEQMDMFSAVTYAETEKDQMKE